MNPPGCPGIAPRWTSSAKTGVGTALSNQSRAWFTLSHGIFDEIYSPRIDQACIRDLGFIVTDGQDFFSEDKAGTVSEVHHLADGVSAFRLDNTCRESRYRIEKEIVTDPQRDTQVMGKPATFWLYGAVTIGAWLFAFFPVPETKGKTLEEIEAHWRAGKHPRAL